MAPRQKHYVNRYIAALCALAILLANLTGAFVVSAEDAPTTVSVSSGEALVAYSREYAAGAHNPDDTIQLALSSGTSFILPSGDDGYIPIGSDSRPFNGKIEIADNAVSSFITDSPLFGTVTTAAKAVNTSNAVRELQIIRSEDGDSALLAQRIVSDGGAAQASWKVTLKPDDRDVSNVSANSFASVVGSIADGCKVSVEFTHDSVATGGAPAEITGSGSVGTICGTLGAGAELTFKITSANTFNVSSSSGAAGGVVGSMGDGAKLIANENFVSHMNVSSSGGYAGGIAGTATNAEILLNNGATLTVSNTVSGSSGAGGVYGRYTSTSGNGEGANASTRTFELDGIVTDSAFTLAGSGDVGVFAGTLNAENSITITETSANIADSSYTKQVRFAGGSYRGLIGRYSNTALTNALDIHNAEVRVNANNSTATSGGAVGSFYGDGAIYATVSNFRLSASGTALSAGVIGNAGGAGSFIDLGGTVDIDGNVTSGVVDQLRAGVLRLQGVTDIANAVCGSAQLVRVRDNGLIYALGSGSDSGWTLNRGNSIVDDVGDWGEVLRLSSANGLAENDFFTVDMTAHTVTVAGHNANMGTVKDFVKTALNIQLNNQDRGALKFSSGSRSSSILGSALTFTADIDLAGTGIVALTRDNGGNNAFTGTLDGGNHTISLAIGEPYGKKSGSALSAPSGIGANNNGTVIGHTYPGLFAKVSNATVSNLTVDGYISLYTYVNSATYNVGGVAAQVSGTGAPITLDNVDTKQDMFFYSTNASNKNAKLYAGGAVGSIASDASGTAVIRNSVFENAITENNASGSTSNLYTDAYVGGAIGYVGSTGALTLDFDDISIAGGYDNNTSGVGSLAFKTIRYGGLVGCIVGNSGSFTRSVTLNNITVDPAANIRIRIRDNAAYGGAFLGSEWLDTNVTIGNNGTYNGGVTIGNAGAGPTIVWKQSGGTTPSGAALVGKATGHWAVYNVKVNNATLTANDPCTFGFLVNEGTNATSSALYLDLALDGYDIAAASLSGTFNVFDEVVANTTVSGRAIEDNGNAVVSIRTAGGAALIMDGSGCNTYQNQTSYGKNSAAPNHNTRYYYNLADIRAKANPSNAEKMLLWSLNRYANASIKNNGFFSTAYAITGSCDMEGLSYYPVKIDSASVSNATVKFYNKEIEDGESGSGNSDGIARSTHADTAKTQHYLMHQSMFLSADSLTVRNLTLAGNVGLDEGNSGFIVRGTLGGTANTARTSLTNITLAGAEITNRSSGDYSPLLINKIGSNVKFDLTTLNATAGSGSDAYPSATSPVASSLIGDVGSDTATNINLTFSDIKLDARTANGGLSGLDTAYGTSRSIFDRATMLNSFRFLNGSLGEYNYEYGEDWTSNRRRVTYGKEVTGSVEYAGREDHYYDDTTHYTHPTDSTGSSAYNFSGGFLPYVYTAYNASAGYHEIKVNVKDVNLTTGCGQYNDPYQVSDGAMLATAAKILNGSPDVGVEISLPTDVGSEDMWCANKNTHAVYHYDGSNFVLADGTGPKSLAVVRTYLAGAYYSISATSIELPADFAGLGAPVDWSTTTNYECPYAFRGVIVGNRNTIINHSKNPLIMNANGCVVKDVTVKTDSTITISHANSTKDSVPFRYDAAGFTAYGAVIGKVMGGDNIIDRVEVDFTSATFNDDSTNSKRVVPVGGYIGVVVNGGVIFRNMTDDVNAAGLTAAKCSYVADDGWLYVNPIIGRVVAGYAFNETSLYAVASAKMNNGTKNYAIPDLNPDSSSKLIVNASAQNNHTIEIPDAQAFYVLSCIVNSGAGSAAYNANTEQAYASIGSSPWIGYRAYTSARCADYDEVGTNASSSGDYSVVAAQDVYTGATKVPYIVRKYTSSNGNTFKARSVCGNSTVASITLTGSSYDLPAGFRGIGGIYNNSTALRIQFGLFNGNNQTVNLSMKYQEYNHESGNQGSKANTQIENCRPYAGAGFGLFNTAYLTGFNAGSDAHSIKDLTLTGSIVYDIRNAKNGSEIKYAYGWHNYQNQTGYYPDDADRIEATTILHTGGVAGTTSNSIYFKNVALDGLTVDGAKYTGGYIGYVQGKELVADMPSASGLTVIGGFAAGGLVGGFGGNQSNGNTDAKANLTVKGSSSSTAAIDLTEVQVKGEPSTAKIDFNDFNRMFHCGGGLVGYACTGTGYTATVQYVTVSGGSLTATKRMRRPSDMRYKILLGGFFGRLENSKVDFSNSSVEGLEISGSTCGGLIGVTRNSVQGTITDVTIDGNNKTIDATNMVGGLIGYVFGGDMRLKLTSVNVGNYSIVSSYNSEKASAGGLIGTFTVNNNANSYFNLTDSKIVDCTVSRCATYTADNSPALIGVGGMFGALNGNANGKVCGHNILLDGVSVVNNGGNKTPGTLIGTNTNQTVRFVGVSVQGGTSGTLNPVGIINNGTYIYGSDGYVVMADFDGDCKADGHNEALASIAGASNDIAPADPFVAVNPSENVGSSVLKLTSDGVSPTVAGLPIQEIIAGDKRYTVASGAASGFSVAKLSDYNSEQNTSLTDNFAVLLIDDVSRLNTTNMINAYINLMANTSYNANFANYAENKSGKYSVSIYKMVYDAGAGGFVKSNEAANLKINSSKQFYMNIDSVDTAGNMFSLIDVAYYDPADTSKIAYHLYIPALVKKMLTFDFEIATGSGTNYERSWYADNDRFGKPLMENLGTPASVFFKYSYIRTNEEWTAAVNNGDNMLRNYAKTLTLSKSASIPDLPADTVLVLVDASSGGKPYYARFSQVYSGGVLSLAGFRETLDDSSSAAFAPKPFNEFLDLTATRDDTEGTLVVCSESAATVRAKLNGADTFFRPATDSDDVPFYKIAVGNEDNASGYVPLDEPYYISFFTEASTDPVVYHYTISAPSSFNDPANPSRIQDANKLQNAEGTVHLILGNIFVQSGTSLSTSPANTEISIMNNNHVVTASMSTTVQLAAALKSEVQGYLGSGSDIHVFHSFMFYLTRNGNDDEGTRRIIAGDPTVTGSYVIASENGSVAASPANDRDITVESTHAQIRSANLNRDLNDYLVNGNGAVITATLSFDYATDVAVSAQFPNRENENETGIGTVASCTSNIAYNREGTSYSKIAAAANDSTGHSYYCKIDNRTAKLHYNVKSDVFVGDYGPLGINPLDDTSLEEVQISTLATYDISDIEEKAQGYDLIRCTVKLFCKSDGYTAAKAFPTYMSSVSVKGYGAGVTGYAEDKTNDYEYVFTLPRSAVESESALATSLEIPLDYVVYTGRRFEQAGLTYSNYKIKLIVELLKSPETAGGSPETLPVSIADNYLIYTNARVLPDYVDPQV